MEKFPLILIPGLLCDAEVWSHQQKNLSNLVDIIIPNLNHAATPQEMVATVLNNAPPYFALAGHSMGGWIALEIMRTASERVLGLGLLNTTALPDSKEKQDFRLDMILQAETGNYTSLLEKFLKSFVYNDAVTHEVSTMLARNSSAFINQEKAMLARLDCVPLLNHITCPTLIIHSSNDAVFNLIDSEILSTKIEHAVFSIIENCGHMSPMEAPERVTELLRVWLKTINEKKTV